ncbi:hypothetical protein CYQ88_00295 [Hydrogenovibrio sp. SC-1]|nr:hypothetical protein CYQ88_00295 [Hydrogenovibrio sp. SC-1]
MAKIDFTSVNFRYISRPNLTLAKRKQKTITSSGLILWIRLDHKGSINEGRLNANDSVINTAERLIT